MSNYYELFIFGVESVKEDLVSSFLFDLGAGGVCQKLEFIQTAENFDPKIIEKPIVDLVAYFEEPISLDKLLGLKNLCQSYEIKEETQKDWLEDWKKHYQPFIIVEDYWVIPEWIKSEVPLSHQIRISPGLAFGTGTHPTTQIMAKLIAETLKVESHTKFLDLGAGTGILSILMYLKGLKSGVATEIDPMAREKCIENFNLNKITSFRVEDENFIFNVKEPFSLVVANIIDGVLINLSESIKKSMSKTLIVSGILDERNELFKREFIAKLNLKVIQTYQKENWWGYVLHLQ